jgi:hypothetical protein
MFLKQVKLSTGAHREEACPEACPEREKVQDTGYMEAVS